jgi:hypothetical protein
MDVPGFEERGKLESSAFEAESRWIPAFAGMTSVQSFAIGSSLSSKH